MTNFIEMTYDEWEAKYRPLENDGSPIYWMDSPNELAAIDPKFVWTWRDGEPDCITNGIAWVNRYEYIVTEIAWNENEDITVTW